MVEVKKAYGKKNPEIQYTIGVPLSYQLFRKSVRSLRSSIQEARGFIERKPIAAQYLGTTLSKMEGAIDSSCSDMTTSHIMEESVVTDTLLQKHGVH
jgi:hypothetical protein